MAKILNRLPIPTRKSSFLKRVVFKFFVPGSLVLQLCLTGCGAGAVAGALAALAGGGGGGGSSDGSPAAGPSEPSTPAIEETPPPIGPQDVFDASQILDIELSPDGTRAYCSDHLAKEIIVIDVANRLELGRLKLDIKPGPLAIHPSGKLLYTLDWSNGLQPYVLEINLPEKKSKKIGLPHGGIHLAVDATRLFVSTNTHELLIKQLPDGPITTVTDSKFSNVHLLLDIPRQKLFTIEQQGYSLARYSVAGGTPLVESYLPQAANSSHLALSADGKALLLYANMGLREISATDLSVKNGEYYLPGGALSPGVFDPIFPKVWAARHTDKGWSIYEFDRKTFLPVRLIDLSSSTGSKSVGPVRMRITPDGSKIVFSYGTGVDNPREKILLVDTSYAEPIPPSPVAGDQPGLYQVQYVTDLDAVKYKNPVTSQVYRRVYAADHYANRVLVIDGATDTLLKIYEIGSKPRMLAVNPAGDLLAVTLEGSDSVGLIRVFQDDVKILPFGVSLYDVAFGPDGQLYVLAKGLSDPELYLVNPTTFAKKKLSVKGKRLAVEPVVQKLFTWEQNSLYRYDIPSGFLLDAAATLYDAPAYSSPGIAFSPDGKYFLFGGEYEYSSVTLKTLGTFERPWPLNPYFPRLYSRDGSYVYGFETTPGKQLITHSHEDRKLLWMAGFSQVPSELVAVSVVLGEKLYLGTNIQEPGKPLSGRIQRINLPTVQAKGTGLATRFFDLPYDAKGIAVETAVASRFSGYAPGSFGMITSTGEAYGFLSADFPHVNFDIAGIPGPGEVHYWGPNNFPEATSSSSVSGDDVVVIAPGGTTALGAQFSGFVAILFPGTYSFQIKAKGWVNLWIGDMQVIPTSGPFDTPTETSGTLSISSAAYYPIELNFGQLSGQATLVLKGIGPGLPGGIIPKHFFQSTTPPPTDPP